MKNQAPEKTPDRLYNWKWLKLRHGKAHFMVNRKTFFYKAICGCGFIDEDILREAEIQDIRCKNCLREIKKLKEAGRC